MPKLYLIDGFNLIYRCCLAKGPDLTSPGGVPTTGVYYFTQSLLKICNRKPDFLVFCLDSPRKTLFRRKLSETYKAKRDKDNTNDAMSDFFLQAKMCRDVVRKLGIREVEVEGFEADDLIATLVSKHQDLECLVISGDKDIQQLVAPNCYIYDMMKEEYIREPEVNQKWGVGPEQVIDMQILMGDSSDCIKGVEGIGPKKALDLIKKFGTADAVFANAHTLSPKAAEAFQKADLPTLRALVTLRKDVPISISLDEIKFGGLVLTQEAKDYFKQLGFKRWAS